MLTLFFFAQSTWYFYAFATHLMRCHVFDLSVCLCMHTSAHAHWRHSLTVCHRLLVFCVVVCLECLIVSCHSAVEPENISSVLIWWCYSVCSVDLGRLHSSWSGTAGWLWANSTVSRQCRRVSFQHLALVAWLQRTVFLTELFVTSLRCVQLQYTDAGCDCRITVSSNRACRTEGKMLLLANPV